MKVLHLIETLGTGGAEHALLAVIIPLREMGIDCEVAFLWPPADLAADFKDLGIRTHCLLPASTSRWNLAKGARVVATLINTHGFDIVHSHLFFAGIYTGLAKRAGLSKAVFIATFHNYAYEPGCNPPGVSLRLRKRLNQFAMRAVNKPLAVSRGVAEHYRHHLKLNDMEVVPHGLNFADLPTTMVPGFRRADHCRILVAGRLVPEKGHDWLLQGLHLLEAQPENTNYEVIIVGEGPERQNIERLIKQLNLSNRVLLHGAMAQSQLLELMGQVDVVVTPSRFEGFGRIALEAMAMGCAVISSSAGGLPEVIGDAGITVEYGNVAELTTALSGLIDHPDQRLEWGLKARIRARDIFSIEHTAAQINSVYQQALE